MPSRVCPWWLGYLLACPLRRLRNDPARILAPHLRKGMTVLEPGPGMGFFTLDMARMVGPRGRVVAVDVQPKMLERLKRRAARAGVLERIDARLVPTASMNLGDLTKRVDFVLAFAVVHELPSAADFFAEVARALKPEGRLLLAEPSFHVKSAAFDAELAAAAASGFTVADRPSIPGNHAALLAGAQ